MIPLSGAASNGCSSDPIPLLANGWPAAWIADDMYKVMIPRHATHSADVMSVVSPAYTHASYP